jgi:thiamine pyrophosphate-dependent acetolactate synthase large subunit-like protein
MVVVRATGTGSILTRLIGWKNKPGMTDVPTKRIIGLAIARVSKARISIKLDNLVLGAKPQRRDTARVARKLWNFDRPYRHAGRELGTGTQIGTSLGVALANKGSGRLVVDLQPDGDLMYDVGALWIAAKYQIPLLIVMYNNRAYYNDWNHQIVMARTRGTDLSRAHIGMDLFGPAPDFAGLARSMGWWAEGPIENADDLQPALERAVAQVKNGKPALVDAVTQHR